MEFIQSKTPRIVKIYMLIVILEGSITLASLFLIKSESEGSLLSEYSNSRLLFIGSVFLFWLGWVLLGGMINVKNAFLKTITDLLDKLFADNRRLQRAVAMLSFFTVSGIIVITFFFTPASIHLDVLRSAYHRMIGFIIWIWLIGAQSLLFLMIVRREKSGSNLWNWKENLTVWLALSIFLLTVFHWLILIFREAIFTSIHGWFWQFRPKDFSTRDFMFGLAILAFLLAVFFVNKNHNRPVLSLGLLLLLGYFLQISYGFIEGGGFKSIQLKYVDSPYRRYAMQASEAGSAYDSVWNYEELYGEQGHLDTKPPGVLLAYMVVEKATALFAKDQTRESRFEALTVFASYGFPLLAVLVLIPAYKLSRLYLGPRNSLFVCALIVACPNFTLITLLMDQFLYPLLFVTGILLSIVSIRRKSLLSGLLTGTYIYAAVFFGFSLLPLAVFPFIMLGIDVLQHKDKNSVIQTVTFMLYIILGLAISYVLLLSIIHYDFFERYANALIRHQFHKKYVDDAANLLLALFINNVEFPLWTGIPVAVLALSVAVRSSVLFFRRKIGEFDRFALSLFVLYILLNLGGQTRSEVGRLWLFLVPLAALLSIKQIRTLFRNELYAYCLVFLLQLITTFLTYKFQDFY